MTSYDYGFRIYNPGIGRFLSVDPLTKSFPFYTPYQFAGNKPIAAIDLDGLEELEVIDDVGKDSKPEFSVSRFVVMPSPVAPPLPPPAPVVAPRGPTVVPAIVIIAAALYITDASGYYDPCPTCPKPALPDVGLIQRDNTEVAPLPLLPIAEIEIYTTDPSTLDDAYLRGVRRRILDNSATGQDYLYADEAFKRRLMNEGIKNLNDSNAISEFVVYEIYIDDVLYKIGKADNRNIHPKTGLPRRLHDQLRDERSFNRDAQVRGVIKRDLGVTTTKRAIEAETEELQKHYDKTGEVPKGNSTSFKPKKKG